MRLRSVCLRTLGSHGKERKPWSSRDSCACAHPASGACCVDHTASQHVPKCVSASLQGGARERGSEEARKGRGQKTGGRGRGVWWLSAWDLTNVTAEDVNEPAAEGLVLTRLLQAHRRPTPEVELALNSACDIIDDAALDVSPACELLDGSRRQRTLQIPLNLSPPVPCRHLQC